MKIEPRLKNLPHQDTKVFNTDSRCIKEANSESKNVGVNTLTTNKSMNKKRAQRIVVSEKIKLDGLKHVIYHNDSPFQYNLQEIHQVLRIEKNLHLLL